MNRITNVFERGNWLSKGDVVMPGVPEVMNPLPEDAPANRLGLAEWLGKSAKSVNRKNLCKPNLGTIIWNWNC